MPSRTATHAKQGSITCQAGQYNMPSRTVLHAKQDSSTFQGCQRHSQQQKGMQKNNRQSFAEHWQTQHLYGCLALFSQVHGDVTRLKPPKSTHSWYSGMDKFKLHTWPKTLGDGDTCVIRSIPGYPLSKYSVVGIVRKSILRATYLWWYCTL